MGRWVSVEDVGRIWRGGWWWYGGGMVVVVVMVVVGKGSKQATWAAAGVDLLYTGRGCGKQEAAQKGKARRDRDAPPTRETSNSGTSSAGPRPLHAGASPKHA